jgi:hypothetical protein
MTDLDLNSDQIDIREIQKLCSDGGVDFENFLDFLRFVFAIFSGIERAGEVYQNMGARPSSTSPMPLPTPAKKIRCLGPFCKNATASKTGYCSFDCEDWSRILAKGTKKTNG